MELTMTESQQSNRLAQESSPYLKQHAHNPVDWYPWGPEALARARQLDRPIFLSIGYSACHWCHVMERESFEDAEVARILNEHFVSIKVDREERPDLDQIYMTAVQMMTGQGGWPMSMFLTPDLKPFYGGTYFPPDDRYGRPSFKRLLLALSDAWTNRRDEVSRSSAEITEHLQKVGRLEQEGGGLDGRLLQNSAAMLQRVFDPTYGGFGSAPKFPHPMELRLLLRVWKRFADDSALHMARMTLDRMAMGGIYDHLGGGFHRYSTDERWLVPHFEKMLYDNALLAQAYLEAYQATSDRFYRVVVEETLAYVQREMTSPEGPFYSTQDADSEGVEGKFFVWSAQEVEKILGQEHAEIFTYVYDITPAGNWDGHNILHRAKNDEQDARLLKIPQAELRRVLEQCRTKLFEVRSCRVRPGRDEKVLTSWNGLMISAFAQAAQVLDDVGYATAAAKAADFVLETLRAPNGRLLRTWCAGAKPKLNAYLEDYAFVLDALVSLYEATFDPRWIDAALDVAGVMIEEFWDDTERGFYYTGRSHEELIARTKDPHDSSVPSGNSMAVTALLRLAKLTGKAEFFDKAETTLRLFSSLMASSPMAAGQMLVALDYYLGPVKEFAVVGELSQPETHRVLQAIRGPFRPNKVVAFRSTADAGKDANGPLELLTGRTAKGKVTTYICQNLACQEPLVGAEALAAALKD
jgi:uncharacterized protein YyaL (SSP411 family)